MKGEMNATLSQGVTDLKPVLLSVVGACLTLLRAVLFS